MKTKAFRKPLSILLTLTMVFGMFAMLGSVAHAEISGSTLIGRYFSTSSYTYDAVSHTDGVVLEGGPAPVFNHLLGMTYFDKAYVRLTRENIFADVTRDSGMTFAFNYRPGFEENHRHIVSIGQNNYGDGTAHHFFISGATAHNSSGNLPMVEWVSGSGETIAAYPANVPMQEGREYNIVVVVDKDAGIVFYIDGEKKTTVYAGSDLNGQIGNVRSFLDEVHTYNKNYVGCSRWTADTKIEGYLSDLRFYKGAASETEAYDLITDMATPPQADQSALIGRYFSTDNVWYDAVKGANGLQWQVGDFPVYNRSNGWTAFNDNMYVRIENEDLFANVTRDTGLTFAFDYIPKFGANERFRHVVSIGQNAYGSGQSNHLFISGAHTQHTDNMIQVTWVNGSGAELVNAYADGVPQVEGKEYSVVVSIDKDQGVVFYVDGVKRNTVYVNSSLNDQLGNIRSFLDEAHNYKQNYFGCSRWTADNKIKGLLHDVCIYKDTYTDDEIRAMLDARAAVPIDLNAPGFNATAYHYTDVATGGYANLAYASPASDNDSGMGIRGADGSDDYKNIGGANLKLFTPLQAVLVYDGARETYVPIQLESKFASQANISKSRIRYATSGSDLFTLKDNWQGYMDSAWKTWAVNYTGTSFSSSSNTESDYLVENKNTTRFFWNAQKYSGTGNTEAYFDHVQNIRYDFKVFYDLSMGGTGDDYKSITTNSDYYILNYRPVYDVLNAANAKYNNEMVGNKWMYTEASYAQAMLAMRHLTLSSPALYDYDARGAGFATRFCAGAIRQAAADYAAVNLVKKQGNVVFRQEDGTPIITIYDVNYGEAVPSGSVPAIPAKSYDDTYHYTDARWDTDFSCISQPETVVTAAYTPVAHDMVTDAAVPANCTETGLTEGSHCSGCEYRIAQTTVPTVADAHDFSVFVETVAPTCVAGGYDVYKCSRCEATTQKNATESDPDAHDFSVFVETVAPTCVAGGYDVYKCSRCEATTQKNATESDPNAHDFSVFMETVAPTCVAGGYDTYKCSRCEATTQKNATESDPDAHDFSEFVETVAPTCVAGGYDSYKCSRCEATTQKNATESDPDAHDFSVFVETVAPTCIGGGYDVYKCSRCEATTHKNEMATAPDAHDFTVFVETVAPTCVAGGYDTYKCSRCEATTQKNATESDPNAHDFSVFVETVAPTCVAGGYDTYKCSRCEATTQKNATESDPNAHDFSVFMETVAPTCVAGGYDVYKCSRCEATTQINPTESDPDAHDFSVFVETVAPTCVAGGYDVYKCSRCEATTQKNATESDPDAHDFSVFVETVAPTCVAGGYDTYKCSRCEATTQKNATESDPNAHDFSVFVETVAPTCIGGGYDVYKCSRCEATTHKNEMATAPDAHDFSVFVETVAPTCVAGGYDVYKCSRCEATTQKNATESDPNAHDFSVFVETVAPTCVAGGYDVYKCSRCEATTQKNATEIAPDAHDFTVFVETVAPTCIAGGYDTYKCSRCDATTQKNATAVDPNAHDFSVFVETVAPTCVAGGYDTYKCSRCEATTQKNPTESDPDAHDFSVFVETVAPTCVAGGYDVYKCSRCEATTQKNPTESDPDAHDFSVFVETVAPTCVAGGYDTYKCSRCEATTQINATESDPDAHDFSVFVETVAPTCVAGGYDTYKCSRCEATTQTNATEVNYNNHATTETVTKDAVAAGYTHTGYTGDTYCKACDHQVGTGEEIAKLDINENPIYAAAVEVAAEAVADPDKYDATAVTNLNTKLDELTAALAVDNNEEAVTTALGQLETLVESMAGNILFTLTVNEDNGTDPVEKKGIHGATVDLGTPEKEGYEFKEWTVTAGSVSGTVYTFTDQNATATAVYIVKTSDATAGAQTILDNADDYDDAYVASVSGKLDELNALDAADPANNAAVKAAVDALNALLEQADANKVYTVTFTVDGDTVKTEKVKTGGSATPPAVDEYVIEGDTHGAFSGWTGDYTNVTASVTVSGAYAFSAHTWEDGEVTKAATCIATGTQDQSCVCGATNVKTLSIDPTAHEYGEWIEEISAGCTAAGTKGHYHCSVCGKDFDAEYNVLDSLVIDKLAHTLHHVEARAAGCPLHAARSMAPRKGTAITVTGNDGNIEYWYCETCDYYYADADATATLSEEQIVIPAAHNLTHHEGTEATHTTAGSKEYWYCDICEMYFFTEDAAEPLTEEQFNEQVTIPAASVHTPGEPVKENETKATCQAGGHYDLVTYCVEGGEELSRETVYTDPDPDAHTPGAAVKENETPATCTEAGSYDLVTYCTLCGDPVATETVAVPAKGHTWGDWTIVRPATEDDPGEARRVCSACGAEETKSAAEVEPVTKIVKFVNISKMHYVILLEDDNTYSVYNSSTVSWYSNESLTFYVATYAGFNFPDIIIYANGEELTPDENGVYTLPNNDETVVITAVGAVEDDSAPNGKLSFWELLIRFFKKIIALFGSAFKKA